MGGCRLKAIARSDYASPTMTCEALCLMPPSNPVLHLSDLISYNSALSLCTNHPGLLVPRTPQARSCLRVFALPFSLPETQFPRYLHARSSLHLGFYFKIAFSVSLYLTTITHALLTPSFSRLHLLTLSFLILVCVAIYSFYSILFYWELFYISVYKYLEGRDHSYIYSVPLKKG